MKYILPKLSDVLFKKIGYTAMVISGIVMLFQSGTALANQNNAQLSSNRIEKGLEMKLQWQKADYAFEFTYNEGFEFEQVIPFSELTVAQQQKVMQYHPADTIVIEAVYSFSKPSYEAYYFQNGKLVSKMDFGE